MAPRHWIVAFRKHVLPMLHIPRPGNRGGEFVATFPSVPCSGCGLAFPLKVGSRRVSVSGREVRAGEKVVGATPGVWLLGSGVASRRGLGNVPCGGSIIPVFPHASYFVRLPESTTSFLALFLLLVTQWLINLRKIGGHEQERTYNKWHTQEHCCKLGWANAPRTVCTATKM